MGTGEKATGEPIKIELDEDGNVLGIDLYDWILSMTKAYFVGAVPDGGINGRPIDTSKRTSTSTRSNIGDLAKKPLSR